MIVDFSIENWLSFKEETKFSFMALNCNENKRELPLIADYGLELLPISALYGGNAAGKTNFVEAIRFAQKLIVQGTNPGDKIPVYPFLLDTESHDKPSNFRFNLLIEETLYEYKFSINSTKVLNEELKIIQPGNQELMLFSRANQTIELGKKLKVDTFESIKKSTREEQLFLFDAAYFNIKKFRPVFDWFKNSLRIVTPRLVLQNVIQKIDEDEHLLEKLNEALYNFDTGISGLTLRDIKPELTEALIQNGDSIQNYSHDGWSSNPELLNHGIMLSTKNNKSKASQLVSIHKLPNNNAKVFNLNQESEGSRRLIDLLPLFFDLTSNTDFSVLIIDEIDRSLHSFLTKSLILAYLDTTGKNSRSQLLFTTHDLSLLNPKILRRDETWVTERNLDGVTKLHSFGDYNDIPLEENIFNEYETGVLGGIPHILYGDTNMNPFIDDDED